MMVDPPPLDPAALVNVRLNSKKESACSPRVDEGFRGIVIATPAAVDLSAPGHEEVGEVGEVPVMPVCGTVQYSAATEARFLSMTNQMLLLAVDARTHAPFVGNLVRRGFEPSLSVKPTPQQLEEWKDRVNTSFFNANAFYFIADLPHAPARYYILATVGDIVSNLRTIDVKGKAAGAPGRARRAIAPGEALFGHAARKIAVPADFRGVKVESRVARWPAPGGPVWIDGVIQLAAADAGALGVTPIQRALVVTASSGFVYRSWNPAGEQSLFADDQESVGGVVRAFFSVDVSKAIGPGRDQGVYVLVTVGRFVANVVYLP
jgi:hypothetical protein